VAPPQTSGQVSGADNNALEEITVTAQHRDENLQKAPLRFPLLVERNFRRTDSEYLEPY